MRRTHLHDNADEHDVATLVRIVRDEIFERRSNLLWWGPFHYLLPSPPKHHQHLEWSGKRHPTGNDKAR